MYNKAFDFFVTVTFIFVSLLQWAIIVFWKLGPAYNCYNNINKNKKCIKFCNHSVEWKFLSQNYVLTVLLKNYYTDKFHLQTYLTFLPSNWWFLITVSNHQNLKEQEPKKYLCMWLFIIRQYFQKIYYLQWLTLHRLVEVGCLRCPGDSTFGTAKPLDRVRATTTPT